MEHCPCSHVPSLSIITMCVVMSEIIGSDSTQYVTTHINCGFQLFFKLNIITCPVQHGWNGISLILPFLEGSFFAYSFPFVLPYVMWDRCYRNKQNHEWELLSYNFTTSAFTILVFRSNQIDKIPHLSSGF